eukprot:TRINITY_DN3262_c0_g1_i2.p2 TRINITY_DN3262_c0_g1~~TRINITY_DN3262_c0_g1_i2.p2  ORF type:complete len:313 (-),score=23.71 TRINITY_DN3262_c0_g1_i2:606-1475(-)
MEEVDISLPKAVLRCARRKRRRSPSCSMALPGEPLTKTPVHAPAQPSSVFEIPDSPFYFTMPTPVSAFPCGSAASAERSPVSKFFIVSPMYSHEYGFMGEGSVLYCMAEDVYDEITVFAYNENSYVPRQIGFYLYRAQVDAAKAVVEDSTKDVLDAYGRCLAKFAAADWKSTQKLRFHELNDCLPMLDEVADALQEGDSFGLALVNHGSDDVFTCGTADTSCNIASQDIVRIVISLLRKNVKVVVFFSFCKVPTFITLQPGKHVPLGPGRRGQGERISKFLWSMRRWGL